MELNVRGSTARLLESVHGATLAIVENVHLEALLFNRNLVGREFQRQCYEATRCFLAHLAPELQASSQISELVILSKGLVYQVAQAYGNAFETQLPVNLIATRRAEVVGSDVRIHVAYQRFEGGGSRLLIGDTIASGGTLIAALEMYVHEHHLEAVYVLTYAGSFEGAERLAGYCQSKGISLTVMFGLAAFGLASNGFDLAFLHPDTITAPEYCERAHNQFDGRAVSAVGWDFGSQWFAPDKYRQLCWMEADKWTLHGHPALALEMEPTDMKLLAGEAAAFAPENE